MIIAITFPSLMEYAQFNWWNMPSYCKMMINIALEIYTLKDSYWALQDSNLNNNILFLFSESVYMHIVVHMILYACHTGVNHLIL